MPYRVSEARASRSCRIIVAGCSAARPFFLRALAITEKLKFARSRPNHELELGLEAGDDAIGNEGHFGASSAAPEASHVHENAREKREGIVRRGGRGGVVVGSKESAG